jgi:outer membrane PBP1 activator LpoA protein
MRKCLRFGIFAAAFGLLACTTTAPQVHRISTQKATEMEFHEYHDAEVAYKNHRPTALKRLTTFIQKHPHTDLTDRACFYAGQLYFDQADYFRASKFWLYITDSLVVSDFYDKALIGAATALYRMSRFDESLNTIKRFKVNEKTDRVLAGNAFELSAKLKFQKGDALGALQDTMAASEYKAQNSDKAALLTKASDIVTGGLTQSQLEQALSLPELQRFDVLIRFRLGQVLYDQKSFGSAKDQFMVVVTKYPDTDQAKSAQGYLNSLEAQQRTDSTIIGVILPLTGKYSQMGYKTLRGIQMGLGLFNKNSTNPLKLAIIDSEGNADIARRGVEKLVSEDHAVVIIGDILSKTATAVALKAQELGVPCLALAQKQDLSEIGDFIFRNTLTPEMQMKSLVDVAMGERGFKKFAIIFPNDSYGTEYASLFWDNVLAHGGEITAAQSYQPEETDFRDAVQRLVGTYYAEEDRGKELQARMAAWQKEQVAANVPKS